MDVLPAIPDPDANPTGILLTDKKLTRWLTSDPIAYATWFRARMATEFLQRKAALATEMRKSIEQVPDWQVKTTLQQLVQVLKVHRDLHFLDDRPPSILITSNRRNGDFRVRPRKSSAVSCAPGVRGSCAARMRAGRTSSFARSLLRRIDTSAASRVSSDPL